MASRSEDDTLKERSRFVNVGVHITGDIIGRVSTRSRTATRLILCTEKRQATRAANYERNMTFQGAVTLLGISLRTRGKTEFTICIDDAFLRQFRDIVPEYGNGVPDPL